MKRLGRKIRRGCVFALRMVGLEKPVRARIVGPLRSARATNIDRRYEERVWADVRQQVRIATIGDGPIVVGPWVSELGYEVLYWIPFLRWLTDRFEIDPARIHVISRGGVSSWYSGIADHYVDIFDVMTPDEFRRYTEARWQDVGGQKQMAYSVWDRRMLKRAVGDVRWSRHSVLAPNLMYRLFHRYIRGATAVNHARRHLAFKRFQAPPEDEWSARLPKEPFVAVKFYFRPSFPSSVENQEAALRIIEGLAERHHVVLLNTGLNIDDHVEVDVPSSDRVSHLLAGVPPSQNLGVQAQAIARSVGFVGTYGGLAYLGPAYGLPSVTLFSRPDQFLPSHLYLSRLSTEDTGGSIIAFDSDRLDFLSAIAPFDGERAGVGS
jgi:hypothetical protein